DTAGMEKYDRLRPLSYPDTDVVLLCFAVDLPDALDRVTARCAPELRHFCPRVPLILLGIKRDLRRDERTRYELARISPELITAEQGWAMAEKIGAVSYMECSLSDKADVQKVFEAATRAALLGHDRGPRQSCRL
uniref:Rho-related GTP-binding protein RhoU n=1 Tax=Macrostomum lignano TaxID=282301 RepID=A0A1I8HET4_9PLAT